MSFFTILQYFLILACSTQITFIELALVYGQQDRFRTHVTHLDFFNLESLLILGLSMSGTNNVITASHCVTFRKLQILHHKHKNLSKIIYLGLFSLFLLLIS